MSINVIYHILSSFLIQAFRIVFHVPYCKLLETLEPYLHITEFQMPDTVHYVGVIANTMSWA